MSCFNLTLAKTALALVDSAMGSLCWKGRYISLSNGGGSGERDRYKRERGGKCGRSSSGHLRICDSCSGIVVMYFE